MVEIIRTDSGCEDFKELVRLLDLYLAEKDGDDHSFYDQYNSIDKLNNVVLIYKDGLAVACGAVKEYSPGVMEVKRMYTRPEFRGQKIASKVLQELEKWLSYLYIGNRAKAGRSSWIVSTYRVHYNTKLRTISGCSI